MTGLTVPALLADHHILDEFRSGVSTLDDWLLRRARPNQIAGASRVFVTCDGERVVGYYALASSAIACGDATGRMRRNMPDPIPVVVLARLAVDEAYQGRKIGRSLMRDAAMRVLAAAGEIGIRGLVVQAISEDAKAFYLNMGMLPSPTNDMTLMIPLGDLEAAL
ncbi:GNAT family N-acetyltransferase [Pseudonocardia sp. TMWB2A]|uniref:GNAT family N-acetyltransferase n=1 Tax=Pseudonocardia sp. TMWB2A TaxID=687430 RepID=UPI00307EFAB7